MLWWEIIKDKNLMYSLQEITTLIETQIISNIFKNSFPKRCCLRLMEWTHPLFWDRLKEITPISNSLNNSNNNNNNNHNHNNSFKIKKTKEDLQSNNYPSNNNNKYTNNHNNSNFNRLSLLTYFKSNLNNVNF